MTANPSDGSPGFLVSPDQPLIGMPVPHDGEVGTRLFVSESEADAELDVRPSSDVNGFAGCWHDLPWHEMERELSRIRHASPPSPPLQV